MQIKMNLKNRVTKLEQSFFKAQINRLIENINHVSDNELEFLFESFATEREKRGLVEKPEIEAARYVFRQLTEIEHLPEGEALTRTLEAAKNNGVELTANDILGADFRQ